MANVLQNELHTGIFLESDSEHAPRSDMSSQRKFKILCLHGRAQNGLVFRNKTGSFRKRLKNIAEFTYIDAPYVLKQLNDLQLEDVAQDGEQRCWYHPDEDKHVESPVIGYNESFALVEREINTNGPYDGILGFSEGAQLLGLICCLKSRKEFQADFKFVIFVSGLCGINYKRLYPEKSLLDIPSFHIIGETDRIIVKERSEQLFKLFDEKIRHVYYHPGGHYLPGNADMVNAARNFFNLQQIETSSTSSST